ncbi:MAG: hypothetical protein WA973_19545 [Mesorhizobium sp.]
MTHHVLLCKKWTAGTLSEFAKVTGNLCRATVRQPVENFAPDGRFPSKPAMRGKLVQNARLAAASGI